MPRTLRGRIVEDFGSIRAFAAAIGWHEQKTARIVNGIQEPTASEILLMANALHVEVPEEMIALFFRSCQQNVD